MILNWYISFIFYVVSIMIRSLIRLLVEEPDQISCIRPEHRAISYTETMTRTSITIHITHTTNM